MLKIKLKYFSGACPAQGEGKTSDGYNVYARYRGGYLAVRRSETKKCDAVCGIVIFGKPVGGEYDGYMTFKELKKHTKGILEFEDMEEE